jgi:Glycosyltransferase family 87
MRMATTELPPSAAELDDLEPAPRTAPVTTSTSPPVHPPLSVLRLPFELRGNTTRSVVLSWLASRAIALALLVTPESSVVGDVSYYARSLHELFHGGSIHQVLQEYPLPVMAIMLPQYLIAAMNPLAFAALFVLSMLGVDAVFTWSLWRVGGRTRSEAVKFWLWFVPAIGPMAYFRFDLVPAMLAGAAVLAAARRPAWSGALTAIGAALKLWPALMLPSFLLRRLDRRPVLKGFLLTGAAIAAITLAIGGVSRVLSPLQWQSGRGLQIESVSATPLMLAWAVHPDGSWDIHVSNYKAYEIFGPGVHAMIAVSTGLTALGLGVLAWLWYRARTLPSVSAETVAWLFLATAAMVTITNKTLSPQYILWLGGPLAALLARWPGDPQVRRAARLLLIICVLTQIVFPLTYNHLTNAGEWSIPCMLVLALRNVLLVRLTWIASLRVLHQTGQDDTPEEPAPKAAAPGRVS